jgi:hypothetical protein
VKAVQVYFTRRSSPTGKPAAVTPAEACYNSHGTILNVSGGEMRDTDAGKRSFPAIVGWPNQGAGRINPDGSIGACSASHTRHPREWLENRKTLENHKNGRAK